MTFSGRLLVQLLDESKGIPIIFAAVMPTGKSSNDFDFIFSFLLVVVDGPRYSPVVSRWRGIASTLSLVVSASEGEVARHVAPKCRCPAVRD